MIEQKRYVEINSGDINKSKQTKIDGGYITADATATPSDVVYGKTFYGSAGKETGTMTVSVPFVAGGVLTVPAGAILQQAEYELGYITTDATATPANVASGMVFYGADGRMVGNAQTVTQPAPQIAVNNSTGNITASYTPVAGLVQDTTAKTSSVSISTPTLIPDNIRSGVTILGVVGNYSAGEGYITTDATVTANSLLNGVVAYGSNGRVVGNIPNGSISSNANVFYVSSGYYAQTSSRTLGTAQGARTITPGITNQVISSGTFCIGNQTVLGDANLQAGNIKKDVILFNVVGTYEGSGGGGAPVFAVTGLPVAAANGYYYQTAATSGQTGASAVYQNSNGYAFFNSDPSGSTGYWYVGPTINDYGAAIAFRSSGMGEANPWAGSYYDTLDVLSGYTLTFIRDSAGGGGGGLIVSGIDAPPNANGTYADSGETYDDMPVYKHQTENFYIFKQYQYGTWVMYNQVTQVSPGDAYFYKTGGDPVGTWESGSFSTGTMTVS